MANKKPLVAGQSPAVVQQIGSSDTLDVPEIKLGTPLAAQYGGLGVDASLWVNGRVPRYNGGTGSFDPVALPTGLPSGGAQFQVLCKPGLLPSAPADWGVVYPGSQNVALGASNMGEYNTLVGLGANAGGGRGDSNVIVGHGAQTGNNSWSVAIGRDSTSSGDQSVAVGAGSEASGYVSIAVGTTAQATHYNSCAIGGGTSSTEVNRMTVGYNALEVRPNVGGQASSVIIYSNPSGIPYVIGVTDAGTLTVTAL